MSNTVQHTVRISTDINDRVLEAANGLSPGKWIAQFLTTYLKDPPIVAIPASTDSAAAQMVELVTTVSALHKTIKEQHQALKACLVAVKTLLAEAKVIESEG